MGRFYSGFGYDAPQPHLSSLSIWYTLNTLDNGETRVRRSRIASTRGEMSSTGAAGVAGGGAGVVAGECGRCGVGGRRGSRQAEVSPGAQGSSCAASDPE
ncbi:hypothetical protein Pcinc_023480 [Petrolisthes cinctipes]|uniref:Uncharacterized protein n=1 Tax=Petrolisthes cinctipes TaxID=88211 RepID=A0AAE1FFA2_PETCI|nr:hypothetical protein Pcinc_023480 [Petrolisthes cinctipes]